MFVKIVFPIPGALPEPLCLLLEPNVPLLHAAPLDPLPVVCILISVQGSGTAVGAGVPVGTGVAVGGIGVAVGGTGVAVGGTGVAVGGTGVAVGGIGV
jgi:hypothetical protein